MKTKTKIAPGMLVALNTLPDATWFEVVAVDGFRMVIREAGTDYATQTSDTSLVRATRPAPVAA